MTHTIETRADGNWITFSEPNAKGEKMTLVIKKITCDLENKKSLMNIWVKNGWLEKPLETYWSTDTYVDKPDGTCYRAYDPQLIDHKRYDSKGNVVLSHYIINFEWLLEATPENYDKIVTEVERRFMNMIPTPKKEEVA